MQKRHRIQFPKAESLHLNQDESYFYLQESGQTKKNQISRLQRNLSKSPVCMNNYFTTD